MTNHITMSRFPNNRWPKPVCILLLGLSVMVFGCGPSKDAAETEKKPEPPEQEKKIAKKADEKFEKYTPEWYIYKYKRYAIKEMKKSGVPASITLAQGMLESNYGKSKLAKKGKNHFGIKCHKGEWEGGEMYLEDDAPNECFRTYESVLQSYRDHSKFLKSAYRYNDLFKLDPGAYKKWAKGLKEAGYATNPRYDELLISLIDRHNLHYYDQFHDKPYKAEGEKLVVEEKSSKDSKKAKGKDQPFQKNGLKAVKVSSGENLETIAEGHGLTRQKLKQYNDLSYKSGDLNSGTVLYLEPKKNKGVQSYHVVEKNETIWEISQQYGIKLEKLLRKNRMEKGQEPAAGSRLFLRETRYTKIDIHEKPIKSDQKEIENAKQKSKSNPVSNQATQSNGNPAIHRVAQGETMQQIARKYDLPVATLYKKNRMKEGQQPAIGAKIHLEERRYVPPKIRENPLKQEMAEKPENKARQDKPSANAGNPTRNQNENKKSDRKTENAVDPNKRKNSEGEQKTKAATKKDAQKKDHKNSSEKEASVFHQVKSGENLYTIAKQYGVGVTHLKDWNDLSNNTIEPGDRLRVKKPSESSEESGKKTSGPKENKKRDKLPNYHKVKPDETLYSISVKYNVPVSRLKTLNDLETNDVEIGQKLRIKQKKDNTPKKGKAGNNKRAFHKVKSDETLFSIAQQYDVTVKELKAINDLDNNTVEPGQKLYLEE